jgi:S-formylglutathione hydrolase
MEQIGENKCFGGRQLRFQHRSQMLDCDMVFSAYLPPAAESAPIPVLYWLSGLTCNDQNFVQKAGAQRYAAEHGIALVAPDTSPRGDAVPDDPAGSYDFGLGAGFYVNATEAPWNEHYRMYDYIVTELPLLLKGSSLPLDLSREAISGHSMGGHGAITIALKNPERFRSVSAFSPISSPSRCPWGEKALGGYLGEGRTRWAEYDSAQLLGRAEKHLPLLVDQGDADEFLTTQLKPELLRKSAQAAQYPMDLRIQPGYDHSYFFVATFIGEHIAFHARHLK